MVRRKYFMAILLLVGIKLMVGCGQNEPVKESVRIAHFANITHAQAIVARENEWFEKAMEDDVEVEYLLFNAGSSEIEAFFSEQVDIGYIGPIPAINGHLKSRGDIIIIAGASNQGAQLVVANGSAIQKIEDLNHKRISVPQIGNTQHIALLHLLSQYHMADIAHGGLVDLVVSNNAEVAAKMRNGDLDAAFLPEPWSTLIVSEGLGSYIEDENYEAFNATANTAVVIVHRDFLSAYPDRVEAFLKVHIDAIQFLETEFEESAKLIETFMSRETGQTLTNQVVADGLKNIHFTVDPNKAVIMNYMTIFHDEGFTQTLAEMDDLIQFERLNTVLKSLNLPVVE